ncbi:MAG: polyprenyl synthetase family protein [Deltaproteobacteria bacterium]|nr:polyprenyl synthetase family protein [Deltaproteobacteria bacterium]
MVEGALTDALARTSKHAPPRLGDAIREAVFPGGARLRPQLCLGVAVACGVGVFSGTQAWSHAVAGAVAVELIHCASLVHDDLPCFDDADLRRGKPTVHRSFGEATAVLAGDALIVLAFETLARAGAAPALTLLAEATGPVRGIIAGQAWEAELAVPLDEYQRAKTGALFEAAAGMGALAAGVDAKPWRAFGELVGRAYQAADDILDVAGQSDEKTNGRDAALGRPNVALSHGVSGARTRVRTLLGAARRAVPPCPGREGVTGWLDAFEQRLARHA